MREDAKYVTSFVMQSKLIHGGKVHIGMIYGSDISDS